MSDYQASLALRKTMEFAGFTYSERASSNKHVTFWRKEFQMPSGRPSAKPIAIVTAIASAQQKNVFMFQTQLALDESLISERYQVPMQQMTPEEFVVNVVPSFTTLFECEDFYVRGSDYAGIEYVPTPPELLVKMLSGVTDE